MTAISNVYLARHLQPYNGLKETIFRIDSGSAEDTIDLSSVKGYKFSKTVVDGSTDPVGSASLRTEEVDLSRITSSDIFQVFGIDADDGSFVKIVPSSTSTLTIGTGPDDDTIDILIRWRSY